MKFLYILFLLIATALLCSDLCAGLFFPLKGLMKKRLYSSYAPSYGNNAGFYGGYSSPSYYRRLQRRGSTRAGRTYTDIARVINGNPYAFPGSQPFPAQPFYPPG